MQIMNLTQLLSIHEIKATRSYMMIMTGLLLSWEM